MTKEQEALLILQEECMEVAHIANKAIRFGIDDSHPKTGIINRDALTQEVGHILAMIDILIKQKVIIKDEIYSGKFHKYEQLKKYSSLI